MALTADKKTEWMEGSVIAIKAVIIAKIYAGALVQSAANGPDIQVVQPAADSAGAGVLGVALESKDAGGDVQTLLVRTKGVFKFKRSGSFDTAPAGADVYVVDDETVSYEATTNSVVAGKFVMLDDNPDYVWVRIG